MPIISNWFQKLPQDIPYGMFRFQFIPWYGESLYKFEQVATGAPTENIYISAGSTPSGHPGMHPGSDPWKHVESI